MRVTGKSSLDGEMSERHEMHELGLGPPLYPTCGDRGTHVEDRIDTNTEMEDIETKEEKENESERSDQTKLTSNKSKEEVERDKQRLS